LPDCVFGDYWTYWLLLDLRAAIASWNPLRHTEFATIRLHLLKIASRITETASRIRIALASCCPQAKTFSLIALALQPSVDGRDACDPSRVSGRSAEICVCRHASLFLLSNFPTTDRDCVR
jgi:hypothetical protein